MANYGKNMGMSGGFELLQQKATPAAAAALAKKMEKKVREHLVAGQKHHQKEEWSQALKHYNEAWGLAPDNLDVLTLVAFTLMQMDAREQAMEVVERALNIHGANETLCQILGVLATNMSFHNIAERLWVQAIKLNPENPSNHANLLGAYYQQEKFDEAVAYAQAILPEFPQNADLWCILATCIQYTENKHLTKKFFEETLRLDPNHMRALNNYGLFLGMSERGKEINERALKLAPDNPEVNIGLAYYYFIHGDLEKAFSHYEYRLNPNRGQGQNVRYNVAASSWGGKLDPDLNLLLMSEQGIGDEIFWLRIIPLVQQRVKKLFVGCDYRLKGIIERSFEGVTAVPHYSQERFGYLERQYPEFNKYQKANPDEKYACIPIGSSWQYFIKRIEDVPITPYGYLKADDGLTSQFEERFKAMDDKPIIGVSWQSGKITAQRNHYESVEMLCKLIEDKDVYVFVLQYSYREEDIRELRERLGERLIIWDDIDLKLDIEANFAIMHHLDMVIGPGVATQMFAMAAGVETWFIAQSGRPWWAMQERGRLNLSFSPNLTWLDYGTRPIYKHTVQAAISLVQSRLQHLVSKRRRGKTDVQKSEQPYACVASVWNA